MIIYDISLPITNNLLVWPGDPPVHITRLAHLDQGDDFTLTYLKMSAHTGTHVDAPRHYLKDPKASGVEALPLNALIGPAWVIDAREADMLNAGTLASLEIPSSATRLLFRTKNSQLWQIAPNTFHEDFVAITEDGAEWLVQHGIQLVGIDYLSIGPFANPAPTHRILLRAGIIILEGLNLGDVPPGPYTLICLPLKLIGADGAPARAVLIK